VILTCGASAGHALAGTDPAVMRSLDDGFAAVCSLYDELLGPRDLHPRFSASY
jgi:hypothetical protein